MNNPTVSDYRRGQAWKAGKAAHQRGKPRASCKRQRGTIYFDDWHDGYNDSENEAYRHGK